MQSEEQKIMKNYDGNFHGGHDKKFKNQERLGMLT